MNLRELVRKVLPFPVRLELLRLKRLPYRLLETPALAHLRATGEERNRFIHVLSAHSSQLERLQGAIEPSLQRGKEHNVALIVRLLDGILIRPCEIFSYHRIVGRPSRLRGFRWGLEIRDGKPSRGVGGGCCQVSNALYYLAVSAGMRIVERHRHGLDLFPDRQRSVPFGCGATVAYNYADLRFENPLPQSVLLRMQIRNRSLDGELRAETDPGWIVEIYEEGHRFFRENGEWIRENRIRRCFRMPDGGVLLDQELAHNRGKVMYPPPEGS